MKLRIIFFLSISVLFITGCSSSLSLQKPENTEYQYSAPWDKELYNSFYENLSEIELKEDVKGGIVPHHLVAGFMPATFFNSLQKQNPSTIVLLGPNHFGRGHGKVITTNRDWKTPYGIVKTNRKLIKDFSVVSIEEEVIKEEHSLYSLIPFIKISLPKTEVVALALRSDLNEEEMNSLVKELLQTLPKDTVIISSIDFSHYQTLPVANFHDEISIGIIKNFDYERLNKLEIDSVPSLYVLLKLMESYNTQKIIHEEHSNSAIITGNSSTKETTSYYSPYFVEGKATEEKIASILFFGDMMLGRNVNRKIKTHGEDYLFSKLGGQENRFFSGMDIITANLEGPFANYRRETTKEIAFQFDPKLIPMLQKYNFSLFSLANNHTLDMGRTGLVESKENLTKADLEYYGTEIGINEETYLIKEVGGIKFGFIGLNDTYLDLNTTKAKELIKDLDTKVDYVVLNIHWGQEYKLLNSNLRQQNLAHNFIDTGVDVIIGHHPHVIQEIEIYKNKPIFYSLGNFVFDQYFSEETQQGLGVGIIFRDNKLSLYILPLEGEASAVKQTPYKEASTILDQVVDKSRLGDYDIDNFNLKINL